MNRRRVFSLLLALCMLVTLLPVVSVAADDATYKITAPHVVKADKTKAAAGETVTVTGDDTISKITVADADGKDVAVTKNGNTYTFKMPASAVTMKTYYATTAIPALQNLRVQGNPFIPIYDFNPDTEPHIWEDPDNPGQYRFYFLSSHDMNKTSYCSNNHVLYSCPVDDPFNWTYHGVIVGPDNTEHDDTLYAPDMCCVEDASSPTGKYYYYYPCNQAGNRQTMVLRSSRPDGKGDPFTVINWADDSHNRTLGSIMTFDPSVFVDDDGKVYGYWGGYQSSCHCAQLDPETMYTAVPGTQKDDMFDGDGVRGSNFGFFEASSMRKIGDTYVFVYSSSGKSGDPYSGDYHHLAYAYSNSPTGPFTYGGVIVDAQAYGFYGGGNTHGSIIKLGDQWYVTYHRNVETDARQAMVSPIDITIDESGAVHITEAEVSSEGFYINGLNPYAKVSLGTASYAKNCAMRPLYEHDVESLPIINLRSNTVFGVTYFDFNTEAPEGATSALNVTLMPNGGSATMNIWVQSADVPDSQKRNFNTANATKIGEIKITSDMAKELTTLSVDTPLVDQLDGKYGVFFTFSDVSGNNFAEFYDMQFEFSDHEHEFEASVVAPTCLESGYTVGKCKVCGKELKYDYTEALGHDWDDGVITVAPTTESTGLMTFTCKRCKITKTKKLPKEGSTIPPDIDFTNPESANQFEIKNRSSAAIAEGTGLALTCTRPAFEDCKEQNSGDQATTPEDVVVLEAEGDWVATLEVLFETNGASNGYYQFFGFYGMEGEDYQNLVGIRGGDGAMQNFERHNGTITHQDEDGVNSSPGFASSGSTYWLRIVKDGDNYTCFRSSNGTDFTEMFSYPSSGIEADHIVIDAYTGMTTGYKFTLKSLKFEDVEGPGTPEVDVTLLQAAIWGVADIQLKIDAGEVEYTEESWAAVQTALTAANAALEAKESQEAVDKAKDDLLAAIDALEEKGGDKFEFDDVKDESKFYYGPVYWAVNHDPQITNGATATTFAPEKACTRGHVVTFLWRAAGEPAPTSTNNPFTDLKDGAFYYTAVLWAVEKGITTGASKTTFAPGKDCTRGQIVTFLWRFKNSPEPTTTENPFGDVSESGYYYKAVLWAVENNVTSGTGKGKFSPDSTCTRGQVVTFLYRATGEAEEK